MTQPLQDPPEETRNARFIAKQIHTLWLGEMAHAEARGRREAFREGVFMTCFVFVPMVYVAYEIGGMYGR